MPTFFPEDTTQRELERRLVALERSLQRASNEVPAGTIVAFGADTAPTGWLLCDGSAVSRTGFADLFAAIGTTWGAGDGSSTFNVPDLVGRFPRGGVAGSTGGQDTHDHPSAGGHDHPSAGGHTHALGGGHAGHGSGGGHTHGTSFAGDHSHSIGNDSDQQAVGSGALDVLVSDTPHSHSAGSGGTHSHGSTDSAGSHSHTGSAGAHTHDTVPDHTHGSVSDHAHGTADNRPAFAAVAYIIRT